MAALRNVVAYICNAYADKRSLSSYTLMQILYLVDWRSALVRKRLVTDLTWKLSGQGPFSPEAQTTIENDASFKVEPAAAGRGHARIVFKQDFQPELPEGDREILDFVIQAAATKPARALSRLVFSTYPVVMAALGTDGSDLILLAAEYQDRSRLLATVG
jgi:hypothetical protein